jgi:hypothetical protein
MKQQQTQATETEQWPKSGKLDEAHTPAYERYKSTC